MAASGSAARSQRRRRRLLRGERSLTQAEYGGPPATSFVAQTGLVANPGADAPAWTGRESVRVTASATKQLRHHAPRECWNPMKAAPNCSGARLLLCAKSSTRVAR